MPTPRSTRRRRHNDSPVTDLSSPEDDAATPPAVAASSDSQLIERCKQGDSPAFAELWKRHAAAGRTVARSFTSSLDPDDLVSEAFTRIYQMLQKGRGPTAAFRPYLFTTIRNTAASWGRARRETSIDTLESFEDPRSSEDAGLLALDRGLTATAFRTLPTRWQEVLWYSEVESMTPAQIAPLLGMTANSVAALSYRAREGLRQAWIGAHLNAVSADEECRWSIERLGGYTRGSLSQRDTTRLEKHLDDCAKCTIAASEARDVGSRLALVLLPLTAGVGGAAAYAYWLQTGGPTSQLAGAIGAMPASITAGGITASGSAVGGGTVGGSAAGSSANSSGSVSGMTVAGIVGVVAVAAGVVAAVALGPGLFEQHAEPPTSVAEGQLSTEDGAPDDAPDESGSASPAPQPTTIPVPLPLAPELVGVDLPAPAAPLPPSPSPSPSPSKPPVVPSAPAAPSVDVVDTGNATLFPVVSGTAEPGATVELTLAEAGRATHRTATVTVAADATTGAWSATITRRADGAELGQGAHAVTAIQVSSGIASAPSPAATFTLAAPPALTTPLANSEHREDEIPALEFTGSPGAAIEFSVDGGSSWVGAVLDSEGLGVAAPPELSPGVATISLRHVGSAGRHGPASATSFTVTPEPERPAAPLFSVDTADGRYFPIIAGSDALPGADIDVLVDGTSVATTTAGADGHWSVTVTGLAANTPYGVTVTQRSGGLSSAPESSAVEEFTLVPPQIASPSDGAGIPLATDVVLLARGIPGADFT
ncbi:MAG: sigma-70 family RNA polymerase sigma factor, partial [Microterricola sp.]